LLIVLIGILQWHPFSISSSPENEYLECHIKNMGSGTWTGRLCVNKTVSVLVDGPYGNPSIEIDRYATLVLCAGGIGITPVASIVSYLKKQRTIKQNKIVLVWVVREEKEISCMLEVLGDVTKNKIFETELYVTSNKPSNKSQTVEMDSKVPSSVQLGRPNFSAILKHAVEQVNFQKPVCLLVG
jgi:predicted ferric reductase